MMYSADLVPHRSECESRIPAMRRLDAFEGYLYYNSALYISFPEPGLCAAVHMSDLRAVAAMLPIPSVDQS